MALEKRRGVEMSVDNPLVDWVVGYSTHLLNRCEVGHDGETACGRLQGTRAHLAGVEFGEASHWTDG